MRRVRIRIHHRHAAPDETVMQVFTQQDATVVVGGDGEDERIPNLQVMASAQVHGGDERRAGGVCYLKGIGPGQHGFSRKLGRAQRLAPQNAKQFAQALGWNERIAQRQALDEIQTSIALGRAAHAFRVGKHMRVKRNAHLNGHTVRRASSWAALAVVASAGAATGRVLPADGDALPAQDSWWRRICRETG